MEQEPAPDHSDKLDESQESKTWWRSGKLWGALGAVGLIITGALLAPVAEKVVELLWPTLTAPCSDRETFLPNDHGVNSGLRLSLRPSTSTGCFTSAGISALEGQDFSGFLEWTNLSDEQQDDVAVKMLLPDGVTIVPNTSVLVTSKTPTGALISDDLVTSTGINVGSYGPGGNFIVQFTLHFSAPATTTCGTNDMPISAYRFGFDGPQLHETVPVTYHRSC